MSPRKLYDENVSKGIKVTYGGEESLIQRESVFLAERQCLSKVALSLETRRRLGWTREAK